jgi:hypothetical protein
MALNAYFEFFIKYINEEYCFELFALRFEINPVLKAPKKLELPVLYFSDRRLT